MTDMRHRLGSTGETIAAAYLTGRNVEIIARNIEVDGGEVDLLARVGGRRLVVEVRTVRGALRIEERLPDSKRRQLRRLAGRLGIHRVDFVGVALDRRGITLHWLRDIPTD